MDDARAGAHDMPGRSFVRDPSAARVLGAALLVGLSVDVLFYGKALGISFLLFVLLLVGSLGALSRLEGVTIVRRNQWLVLPLLFFAAMVFVRANSLLTFLNVVFSLALLGLIACLHTRGGIEALPLVGYPLALLWALLESAIGPASLVATGVDVTVVRDRGGRNLGPVVRGLVLALPVVLVFAALLAAADIVFASFIEDFLRLDFLADLVELAWRGVMVMAAAWLVAGGLAFALGRGRRKGGCQDDAPLGEAAIGLLKRCVSLGPVEASTVLLAVGLLFLAFAWVQFAYLFGGEANISTVGFTYAEYARRGFFELLAVAVLTMALILGLHTVTRRETAAHGRWFSALGSALAGLVLVLLASAHTRLVLYEEAYGLTQLRLFSHVSMAWLGASFLWLAAVLWARPHRFAIGALGCALGFLITMNVINPDAVIAGRNLERYLQPPDDTDVAVTSVDARYLTRLSDDAVPVLVAGLAALPGEARETLTRDLGRRRRRLEEGRRFRPWPAFHLARQRAYDLLSPTQLPPRARHGPQGASPLPPGAVEP